MDMSTMIEDLRVSIAETRARMDWSLKQGFYNPYDPKKDNDLYQAYIDKAQTILIEGGIK